MPTLGTSLKVNYKGTYSSSITYNTNDIVFYNGTSYIALTTSTGQTPAVGTYWGTLAAQGSTGSAGATGSTGTAGAPGVTPSISATASGLAAGASPTVTTTGTTAAPILNFGIPAGAAGAAGGSGSTLVATSKTAAYSAAVNDLVLANATTAAFTVTLPTSPTSNAVIAVKKTDSSTNVVTIAPGGTATIDGDATCTLSAALAGVVLQYDGTNWRITSTALIGTAASSSTATATDFCPTVVPSSGQWYSRRDWFGPSTLTFTTVIPTVSTIYYVPLLVSQAVPISAVAMIQSNTQATSGAQCRVGLYTSTAAGAPGTLLYDWGLLSFSTTIFSIPQTAATGTIPKGWSYLAFSFNSTNAGTVAANSVCSIPPGQLHGLTDTAFQTVSNFSNGPYGYYTQPGNSTATALAAVGTITPQIMNPCPMELVFKAA